jgi:hypothetical protein
LPRVARPRPDRVMSVARPAFYAAGAGGWRDWWTILHPPYTAWHLSYVVIGATLAPDTDGGRLVATLLAFFFAVGIAAHALDELHGRPLRTHIASLVLVAAAAAGLLAALAIGVVGFTVVGPGLLVFIAVGPLLVLGYNLEWVGGWLHTDVGFAVAWGAFPVLTAYYAQAERLELAALLGAVGAVALSLAQRSLSTPARALRRRVARVEGSIVMRDGAIHDVNVEAMLQPLERALRTLSWAMVAIALALASARFL